MKSKCPNRYGLELNQGEALEIFSLLEAILRDNTPEGDNLEGHELVRNCLLHNDPETFRERNQAFAEAIHQFSQIQGIKIEPEEESFQEAEEEYTYLSTIANIYSKLLHVARSK